MLLHRRLKVVVVWDPNTLRTAPTHGQTALRRLAQADPDGWDFTRGWTVVNAAHNEVPQGKTVHCGMFYLMRASRLNSLPESTSLADIMKDEGVSLGDVECARRSLTLLMMKEVQRRRTGFAPLPTSGAGSRAGFPLAGERPIMLGDRAGGMTGFIDHFPGLMKVHCGWHLFMNVNEQKEVQAEAARKGKGVKFDSEQLMWAIQGAESEQAYNEALGILRLANGCAADYVAKLKQSDWVSYAVAEKGGYLHGYR